MSLENVITSQFLISIAICQKLSVYILLFCYDITTIRSETNDSEIASNYR